MRWKKVKNIYKKKKEKPSTDDLKFKKHDMIYFCGWEKGWSIAGDMLHEKWVIVETCNFNLLQV